MTPTSSPTASSPTASSPTASTCSTTSPYSLATLAALCLAVASVGCGSGLTGQPETRPSDAEQKLRRELVAMEQRAIMGEVEAERLRAKVAQLEEELEQAEARSRTGPTARPAEPVGDDVGAVTLAPEIESVLLEDPGPPPGPSLGSPRGPAPGAPSAPAGAASTGATAQEIYDQGYALFHQRSYQQAELAFGQVLEHHSDHQLADNALFWIGESRYARGDYPGALEAFTETVERYPEGNKVGDAMLKAGKCLEALGQKDRAIRTYRELRELFPDTAAALVAEERLGRLQ